MRTTETTRNRTTRIRRKRGSFNRSEARTPKGHTLTFLPRWVPVAASLILVVMVTVTINFRAYSELRLEEKQNSELNQNVQQMTSENLSLQEEIYYLKNDSATIEREAKKYGLIRPAGKNSLVGEMDKAEESINRQPPTRK